MLYCHGNAGNLSHRGNSIVKLRDESEFPMKADDLRQRVRATIGDDAANGSN